MNKQKNPSLRIEKKWYYKNDIQFRSISSIPSKNSLK